jgi:hypothetical protein
MRALFLTSALVLAACVEPALPVEPDAGTDAGPFVCSPLTCTGCCRENVCLGGNEQDACGYDGRWCQGCPADTACVSPGACVSRPRDGGVVTPRDGGGGLLIDPLTGKPLEPPRQRCVWVFYRFVCS